MIESRVSTHHVPEISAFITCYREGRLLLNAVESLERQTDRNFEFFVVNDGSPDPETNDVCRQLERENGVRVIWRGKNEGLAAARNTGFESISGDIGVPLDADDVLPDNAIAIIRKGFAGRPDADFLFGGYILHDVQSGEKRECDCRYLADGDGRINPEQLAACWRLLGTSPCTREIWKKVGGYRLDYSNDVQDKDFWIRVIQSGGRGYFVDQVVYIWNRSPVGMNSSVLQAAQNRLLLDHLGFFEAHWSRSDALNKLIDLGQYRRLRAYATTCLKNHVVSPRLLFIGLCPYRLLRWYYEADIPARISSIFSFDPKR